MEIQEFEEAIRKDDFAIGDSFWIGDWEFEVVNRRQQDGLFCRDEAVFKWQLTDEDFVASIKPQTKLIGGKNETNRNN